MRSRHPAAFNSDRDIEQERLGRGYFNRWILEEVEEGCFRQFEGRRRLHLAAFSGVTQDPLTGC